MSHPTSLFFFGTLRHPEIAATVLGRPADRLTRATLPGFRVARAGPLELPVLARAPDQHANGLLAQDLTAEEVARLDFYEAGFDYALRDVTVDAAGRSLATQAYFADALHPDAENWDFEAWTAKWFEMTIRAAREVMSHFGHMAAEELQWRFPQIRVRAAAAVQAGQEPSPESDFNAKDVKVIQRTRPYDQFFALDEFQLTHPRFDGGESEMISRAVLMAADAVTVLPYDPKRDRVLIIEQFRAGPLARGDQSPWLIEPIAGRMDPGETPEDTARREAEEEAGVALGDLIEIARYYPSPGAMSEYLFSFIALCDLPNMDERIGGLETEAEDIRVRVVSYAAFAELVAKGGAVNGPLILSALWLSQNRERLRAGD
ncbi:MAG: NUDIX domain-containing protein [Rhodobacteraceae bacterium]|nr:NUDIX domain-containing protein [Paracoccaceae bacterium]